MTYNVHGCRGLDLRRDLDRVARVIAHCDPDVVALQELDVERPRSGRADQPALLASLLHMNVVFSSARECDGGRYGNAVLSRHQLEAVRAVCLPQRSNQLEQRAVQWVLVTGPRFELNVINTHLGLDARERLSHAAAILGQEWVHEARGLAPTVLCGDFNSSPRSDVYRTLTRELRDAQLVVAERSRPRATFPSIWPFMRIDHVLVAPELQVRRCHVPAGRRVRIASDHLPLVVDLELPGVAA
jgi:endonuclease/exonuclease/phosphatase family metal-dependent hydrolase